MLKILRGSRRVVIIGKTKVFKMPRFKRWVSFIRGIEENLEERYWWSSDGSRRKAWSLSPPLAEIYWADRFGFLLIMEKLDTSFLENGEVKPECRGQFFKDLQALRQEVTGYSFAEDLKPANVGYRGNKLLVLDYGFFGGSMDCYIGT